MQCNNTKYALGNKLLRLLQHSSKYVIRWRNKINYYINNRAGQATTAALVCLFLDFFSSFTFSVNVLANILTELCENCEIDSIPPIDRELASLDIIQSIYTKLSCMKSIQRIFVYWNFIMERQTWSFMV